MGPPDAAGQQQRPRYPVGRRGPETSNGRGARAPRVLFGQRTLIDRWRLIGISDGLCRLAPRARSFVSFVGDRLKGLASSPGIHIPAGPTSSRPPSGGGLVVEEFVEHRAQSPARQLVCVPKHRPMSDPKIEDHPPLALSDRDVGGDWEHQIRILHGHLDELEMPLSHSGDVSQTRLPPLEQQGARNTAQRESRQDRGYASVSLSYVRELSPPGRRAYSRSHDPWRCHDRGNEPHQDTRGQRHDGPSAAQAATRALHSSMITCGRNSAT